MTVAPTEYPLERVRKWCPDRQHVGDREYEGWMWVDRTPLARLATVHQDDDPDPARDGRYAVGGPVDVRLCRWDDWRSRCGHMIAVYLSWQLPAPVRRALRQSVAAS